MDDGFGAGKMFLQCLFSSFLHHFMKYTINNGFKKKLLFQYLKKKKHLKKLHSKFRIKI